MDGPGQIAAWGLAFRIGERVAITVVVILMCLVVTVGFWRSIQKLDFQLTRDKLSGAGNVVLTTPVFAMLALIGFSWVSFSHPVSVNLPAVAATGEQEVAAAGSSYIGVAPSVAAAGDAAFARRQAEGMVRSLNCLANEATAPSPREQDALAEAKLAVLGPVWAADWGDAAAFRAWALGRSTDAPNAAVAAVFAASHPEC